MYNDNNNNNNNNNDNPVHVLEIRFFVHLIAPLLRYSEGVIRWTKNELQTCRMHRTVKTLKRNCTPEMILQEYFYQ